MGTSVTLKRCHSDNPRLAQPNFTLNLLRVKQRGIKRAGRECLPRPVIISGEDYQTPLKKISLKYMLGRSQEE